MKLNSTIGWTMLLLFLGMATSIHAQISFGQPQLLNDGWRFTLNDPHQAEQTTFDDSKWRLLDLPHDWTIEGTLSPSLTSCTGYLPGGVGWYRKQVNIPADKQGQKFYIYFEGVYNHSEVFVNGHSLGKRPNGYISFMYDLTPYLVDGDSNTIAVRVDHSQSADSRWYTGSGIYRNVYLVAANPIHIDQWGIHYHTAQLTKDQAKLRAEVSVRNTTDKNANLTVTLKLNDSTGKLLVQSTQKLVSKATATDKIVATLNVKKPLLWSIDRPYLYQLQVEVWEGDKLVDASTVQNVGIRTTTFDPDKGFALNNEWMKVKGVCIHHDAGVLGAAVPSEVWKRRLITLKKLGCNAIRMSHNPQAPAVYNLCDELGLLVIDEAFDEWEFPKKKWIEGWNRGKPGFQGNASFFKEWSSRDIHDLIMRDRNHPSIIMWSIGNEVDYPNDPYSHPILAGNSVTSQPVQGGYLPDNPPAERLGDIAKRLVEEVKAADTSRAVTAALAGVMMSNATAYPFAVDVTGYNYTENQYEADHKAYPKRVIYGSENGHSMEAWKVVRDNDYIFGQFLWTGIDYLGEANAWPSRGFYSGLLDFGGFQKPRGFFRQALWDTKPFIYIGTYAQPRNPKNLSIDAWPIWNYQAGEMIRVVSYTNCQSAQLLLDGKEVGGMKPYDDNTGVIYWDIPYQAGTLEVVGFNENKEAIRYAVRSSERPATITAVADVPTVSRNKGLAHVTVQIVDKHGVPVMWSDDEITCTVEGPGKLLGLEASNNTDMSSYTDNVHRVFHGRILAYVQATGNVGAIKVKFTAPWLTEASVVVQAIE